MVDKDDFKEKTDIKQTLVATDEPSPTEATGSESAPIPGENKKHHATALATTDDVQVAETTTTTTTTTTTEAGAAQSSNFQFVDTDEDQLRERCFLDLTAPLKPFTERVTAHLMEHSEEVSAATGVGIAPSILLITSIVFVVVLFKEGSNFLVALKDLWWILAGMIPLYGMCLGATSLVGRWLWLHGCYRSATSSSYFASTPAKFLPHGFLNSHLARRSLCALYLAQGLPLKAQNVSTQFSRAILTPEGTALTNALEAEAAAKAGQRMVANEYAQHALKGLEDIGVEPYIKARLGRELFNHLGNCHFALGDYEKARKSYIDALKQTTKADKIDQVALIIAIINLARASTASGHVEQAYKWLEILSDENNLSIKVPIAMKGELLLAHAETLLASGDEEKTNKGLSLLKHADDEFRKHNVYPDMGSTAHKLGKISAEREENAEAEAYFRRALKVKLRSLPEAHPSIVETRHEIVNLLRRQGKTEAAAFEISLLPESHADKETISKDEIHPSSHSSASDSGNKDPLAIGKQIRAQALHRQIWILGGTTVYFLWQLVTSGIRAADPFFWAMLALWMALIALLVGLRLNSKSKQSALKHASTLQQSIECTVSFKRNTRPDDMGIALLAVLEEPFNRECVVKNEFEYVSSNLAYYARPQKLNVFMDGDSPVSIQTPDGFVQLAPDKSLKEVHKQQSASLGHAMLIAVVCIIGLILTSWFCISLDRDKTPTNLTAFEYYRSGAHEIQNDWSGRPRFYDLEKVKKMFDLAIEKDKNGPIGKLASSCENAELPRTIPKREILSLYEDGIFERTGAEEAEKSLRTCIERAPDFDWAYCGLAQKMISQGKLQEAESLLENANKLRPNSNMYLLTKAKLCLKTGNYQEAKTLIKKAIDNDPYLFSSYQALIGATLGL